MHRDQLILPPIDLSAPLNPSFVECVAEAPDLQALAPFVYLQAKRDSIAVRQHTLEHLRCLHVANHLFSTLRHEELVRRLEAFAAESIPVIPLKGTFLAKRLYPDVGGRALGYDLDLLVRRDDVAAAAVVLERDGFRAVGSPDRYDRPFERIEADTSTTTVELHAELLPRWFCATSLTNALWARSRPPTNPRVPAWTLDPGDEVLHLCMHLIKDQLETCPTMPHLRHGLDIHLALEHWGAEIDWAVFAKRAREHNLHAYAGLAFGFVAHWFGSIVPEALTAELPRWKRAHFARHVWPLEASPPKWNQLPRKLRLLGLILLLDDRWRARIAHLGWVGSELRERRFK